MSQHAFAHRPPVGRVGILPVEGGDAHGSGRRQRGLQELGDVCDAPHPARRVHQRDQPVGLAAVVGGVEAEDRGRLAARAGEAPPHIGEQVPEPPGRVRPGEEPGGVEILRPAPARDDLREIRREVGLRDRSLADILPRTGGLEDRRDGHGFRFVPCPVPPGRAVFRFVPQPAVPRSTGLRAPIFSRKAGGSQTFLTVHTAPCRRRALPRRGKSTRDSSGWRSGADRLRALWTPSSLPVPEDAEVSGRAWLS